MYVFSMKRIKYMIIFLFTHRMLVVKKILWLGQTKKIIASQANFQKYLGGSGSLYRKQPCMPST